MPSFSSVKARIFDLSGRYVEASNEMGCTSIENVRLAYEGDEKVILAFLFALTRLVGIMSKMISVAVFDASRIHAPSVIV